MSNLELTIGISGSGKSTWAKKEWEKNPKTTVLVSRDKIRELLFGYSESNVSDYYQRKDIRGLENIVTKYQDELIRHSLNANKRVIVDATHLRRKYIEGFRKFGTDMVLNVFNTDENICIERDFERTRTVGKDIIKRQMRDFKNLKPYLTTLEGGGDGDFLTFMLPIEKNKQSFDAGKRDCIVVDVDGTIADKGSRIAYDWLKVGEDLPKLDVIEVVKALSKTYDIVICTGRDGVCLDLTKKWLKDFDVPFSEVFIRKAGDNRPDFIVKAEMWKIIENEYNILGMIDDRRQVIDHARFLGYRVYDVANHTF